MGAGEVTDVVVRWEDIALALQRLDRLLALALKRAEVVFGNAMGSDPFRGLHISPEDVQSLLARRTGAPLFGDEQGQALDAGQPRIGSGLTTLRETYSLSSFDLDVIIIALATEADLRYERLYAYLQDDVTRKRPTVDLALNLLCESPEERLRQRSRFLPDAPLIKSGLVELVPDQHQVEPSLLSRYLKLDEQLSRWLLGSPGLDARLASCGEFIPMPPGSIAQVPIAEQCLDLLDMVTDARQTHSLLTLYFQGPPGVGKRVAAESLAGTIQCPLLVLDANRALSSETFEKTLGAAFLAARLNSALLYVRGLDALRAPEQAAAFSALLDHLSEHRGVVVLAGSMAWIPPGFGPAGVLSEAFSLPGSRQRKACWAERLAAEGISIKPEDLGILSSRFRLSPRQIADAAAGARNRALQTTCSLHDLSAAARAQSGSELQRLAKKIEPRHCWSDLILPDDTMAQLRELCDREMQRERVLGEWGFDQKLSLGKGNAALFSGTPGTGKTMAAEVIANELGLDLYKIDLSRIVNKYIGETEKNLDRIFSAAEDANAILFFDEADALFGKRTDVRDAHDRYANIEVSYLLQKMEEYDGLAILATNLRDNMDEAFMRRLAFSIYFPFPDDVQRLRIWHAIWPTNTPLSGEVNLDFMANEVKVSGGSIKNIALSAAYLAAAEDSPIIMNHLLQAANREFEKLGRSLSIAHYQRSSAVAV